MNIIRKKSGFTIVEILIAVLLSGIVLTAGVKFYTAVQNQSTVQMELSNIQNLARCSLDDIKSNLRLAGYKLTNHPAYEIIDDDKLQVYYNITNPVDTVAYYLANTNIGDIIEYSDDGYTTTSPVDVRTYELVKRNPDGTTSVFADNIVSIKYLEVSDNVIRITITTQAELQDEAYELNNGYRRWTLTEEVCLRNI